MEMFLRNNPQFAEGSENGSTAGNEEGEVHALVTGNQSEMVSMPNTTTFPLSDVCLITQTSTPSLAGMAPLSTRSHVIHRPPTILSLTSTSISRIPIPPLIFSKLSATNSQMNELVGELSEQTNDVDTTIFVTSATGLPSTNSNNINAAGLSQNDGDGDKAPRKDDRDGNISKNDITTSNKNITAIDGSISETAKGKQRERELLPPREPSLVREDKPKDVDHTNIPDHDLEASDDSIDNSNSDDSDDIDNDDEDEDEDDNKDNDNDGKNVIGAVTNDIGTSSDLKPSRFSKTAMREITALRDSCRLEAQALAKKYNKTVRQVMLKAGFSVRPARASNIWNMFRSWYALKYKSELEGCKYSLWLHVLLLSTTANVP